MTLDAMYVPHKSTYLALPEREAVQGKSRFTGLSVRLLAQDSVDGHHKTGKQRDDNGMRLGKIQRAS